MPEGNSSLKNKTIKGLGWSAIDNAARMGITFIVGIVLARLLSPDEYGLIGILTIFVSVFNAIVDSGFTNALIRKKDVTDIDYCTVFYTNLVVSVVMALALFLSARPIALFFKREELISLTQVMSSIVIINAFCIVQKARTTKNIDFKTQTKVTFISSFFSGVIGILMAFMGCGIWALVSQLISSYFLMAVFFWFYNKWIPKLIFSWKSFKEMWSFGWKLMAVTLIDTTWKEIYQVVVGKCYSPATLGLYTRALQFSQLFSTNLTMVVQRVSFPVFSTIQDEDERLKSSFRRVIRVTMLPTFLLMLGLSACAKSVIMTLIGEKWIDCVPFLQLICISAMLYPLHSLNLNMLQVKGRSDLFLKLEIIKKCILVAPLLLGIFVNIYAMLGSSIITGFICLLVNAQYNLPLLGYSIKEQLMDVAPSLFIAIVVALPVYLLSFIPISCYILLPIQVFTGALLAFMICERLKKPEYLEIKDMLKTIVVKIKK